MKKDIIKIREITDKKEWENFLTAENPKTFLQSWNWGETRHLMGDKLWRLRIYEKDLRLVGVVIVVKIFARRGKFL